MKNCLMALLMIGIPALSIAQSSSENFILTKSVIDAGGGASSSENFNHISAFGQPTPVGTQTSENFVLHAGFLHPEFFAALNAPEELTIYHSLPDVVLRWEAVPTATKYYIHRSLTSTFAPSGATLIDSTAATTYTQVNAMSLPQERYFYSVVAYRP